MAVARKARAGIVTPGRVPTLPVEVDWSHPLANGLIACYVPGGSRGLVDLTGNGPIIAMSSGAKLAPTTFGAGLATTISSSNASSPNVPGLWFLSSAGTLFASSDFYGTPGGGNGIIWGLFHSSANVAPFTDYLLFIDFSTKQSGLSYNSGSGVANSALSGTLAPTSGRHSLAATFVMGGGAVSFYHDGAPVGSSTWTGGPPVYTSPVAALGGNPTVSAKTNNTGIAVALTYNRILSAGEIARLNADPFCMLQAVRRPVFVASTSSTLALASIGSAFSRGRGVLSLSQSLASRGAAFSQGRGALTLGLALTARGAAVSRGRGSLTLLTPFALSSVGSARSAGFGGIPMLSMAFVSRGEAFSQGRGVLTLSAPFALTSLGAAFSRGRVGLLDLPTLLHLHARGQAFSHGGALFGHPGAGHLTLTPFVPFQNVINIGFPQRGYPMVDPKTGHLNDTWFRFLQALWLRSGGNIGS